MPFSVRVFFAAFVFSGLMACSDNDKELSPAKLVDLDEKKVVIDRDWKSGTGKGQDVRYTRLAPTIVGDRIYTTDIAGNVRAFEVASGKRLWKAKLDAETSGGVGAAFNLVTVGTYDGEVIALSTEDGSELWRQQVSSEVLSAPKTDGRVVIVHTSDGRIFGLDVDTGEQRWLFDNTLPALTLRGTASPLLTDNAVYAGFANGKVVALEADTGLPIWDQRVAIPKGRTDLERVVDIDGSPMLVGDILFAASYQGRLVALSRANGRGLWAQEASTYKNLGAGAGRVFYTTDEDIVVAVSAGNGQEEWRNDQMIRRSLTGPVYVDGYVVVADADGYVHVLDAATGEYLGRDKVDGSGVRSPLLVNDEHIYVLDNDGDLSSLVIESASES
nr:outer membrane protein assembly factor BamB [Marinibactrum halimedae]